MPVLLYGLVGGLVFLLARRVAGPRVALLTWWIWLTAPGALAFRASYLSQSTSSALWLVGWFLLLRWRESGRTSDLVALAVCTGLEFLTRPLTMLAFSFPVGVVVLREVWKRRAWRAFGFSIAAGAVVLALMPLWSYETLGDWRTTPYSRYSRVYYPYQRTGFTFDDTPSLRPHPPEMEPFDRMFRRIQHEHRLSAVPEILEARLEAICRDLWGDGRRFLVAFAMLGLLGASAEALFGVAACGVLVLAYLVYAHSPGWSVYYMEGHPALALATALGLDRVLSGLSNRFAREPAAAAAFRKWAFAAVFLGGLILPSLPQLAAARDAGVEHLAYQTGFHRTIAAIADHKAVVFVKYSPTHDVHRELVSNDPDLTSSRAWIVYDRGPRNEELMRLAPDRIGYVYDDARRRLIPLRPPPRAEPSRVGARPYNPAP
jgi:4-amino-4-deoxy-L-arabinose transferase-like glycosyltransferase